MFNARQLLAAATFVKWIRASSEEMRLHGYPQEWTEALKAYQAAILDRLLDYNSTIAIWLQALEAVAHTFTRFALPITWDFCEANPLSGATGDYSGAIEWVAKVVGHLCAAVAPQSSVRVENQDSSATTPTGTFDIVFTDPPYYDAIPYGDLADFFYVWLRRVLGDEYSSQFAHVTAPKSDELALRLPHTDIPHAHNSKWYEERMALAFRRTCDVLSTDGRMVIVFAHKDPTAWENLVSAMIGAGFVVTASWPIDTERQTRIRSVKSAALSSSIWLVCRKRGDKAGVGRYAVVRRMMQERVVERLRYFWDVGISGPDFVWAAIGPALEAYSSYDEVRRLDGSLFTVAEFLREVRRLVADFLLGQILKGRSTEGLDEWSRYYLMHRNYFGLQGAPVGECILLSQGYGIGLDELRGVHGLLTGHDGSSIRLVRWDERKRGDLGEVLPSGDLPLIDALHRLMHLWEAGDLNHLNTYVTEKGLRENELLWAVAQAVLEMAKPGSRERTLIEALVAWGRGKASANGARQERLPETGV